MSQKRLLPIPIQLILGTVLLVAAYMLALTLGAADTGVRDIWLALTSGGGEHAAVLRELRIPRVTAAVFTGAALGVAGAIMQGVTRNPLADPGLLGLTSGANAALALSLALIPGITRFGILFACFAGAAAGMAIVFSIGATSRGGMSAMRLVVAGAAVTAFLQAIADGTGIVFKISKDVSMWTAGGLMGTTPASLIVVPFIVAGLIAAMLVSRQLTILSLQEEVAVGLGQRVFLTKAAMLVITALLAGAAVALVGNLAFIGLIIPHLVRAVCGSDYRAIIPLSALAGGIFMVLADMAGRLVNAPFETPVVAITALIGLPFFLIIVRKGGLGHA
ncbi:FecCD family ABC transporter permease [Edaphobacillus lindanitolerans]|uniref:Iron complex transport system permease protein n=1 Tax=Edaphobacillus lindanitolerans TaxID=550447 RepID=A0A1U7PMW5_9BACI|nr:iron ABC transporter permease [Edaphobacillus lindanitolerans]SIT71694.1 iron complex transport system permease protein [Edaphobacillus lindanitolerans]